MVAGLGSDWPANPGRRGCRPRHGQTISSTLPERRWGQAAPRAPTNNLPGFGDGGSRLGMDHGSEDGDQSVQRKVQDERHADRDAGQHEDACANYRDAKKRRVSPQRAMRLRHPPNLSFRHCVLQPHCGLSPDPTVPCAGDIRPRLRSRCSAGGSDRVPACGAGC